MNGTFGVNSGLSATAWCVVGGGNMASAIVLGAIDAGVVNAGQFVIVEIDAEKRRQFEANGIAAVATMTEGMTRLESIETEKGLGIVLLAVKPQMLGDVASELRPLLAGPANTRRVVSILAGTPTSILESALGNSARILRAMPNTPAKIRRGTTALACGKSARPNDDQDAANLFGALGLVLRLDESLFDAFTAIAGSGPAYLFYLAEGLIRAAVEQGFSEQQADSIVRSMLAGSAELLAGDTAASPANLRAAVTSKGGTTAAATSVLDSARVLETFGQAIAAATERGRELSRR